ncbi:hypothetical protein IFR05_004388 [Cadophora sp. M221]|nr:hypothetical protein IFR05_004388 [Cadophora sp. M221]
MSVRREWGTLSRRERIAYTDAVLCLQFKSALNPADQIPGARSRFDDFVGTHINQTLTIHYTVYEQSLRNEYGYKGVHPHWDWTLFSDNTEGGPVFDGSSTGMSGNGEFVADKGDLFLVLPGFDDVNLPAGNGGGCITSGPFANMSVNLGPVFLPINGGGSITGSGLDYKSRCLVRDIGSAINNKYSNATAVADLLTQNSDIYWFQTVMQGVLGSGSIGVHGGSHYNIAGNPGADTFISPGDPAFYLHHGMIDRTWCLWQNQDPANRLNAIPGTGTFMNGPPSANTTLDTLIDAGFAGNTRYGPIAMKDLMSTVAGPSCYTYHLL